MDWRGDSSLIHGDLPPSISLNNKHPRNSNNLDWEVLLIFFYYGKNLNYILSNYRCYDLASYERGRGTPNFMYFELCIISKVGMVFLNRDKAFYKVEWLFLFEVLKCFNFAPMFRAWVTKGTILAWN